MAARLLGGVLIGGRSRRMGRPKQFVEIGETTMIERVVQALSEEVDEVVLLGAGPIPAALGGLQRKADADGCRGPIAGILGAMRAEPQAAWVMAPCDLPLLRPEAVRWLVNRRSFGTWAVFPSFDGFVEPLLAIYEPDARALLETAAAAGEHALYRLARNPRAATAEPPESLKRCWFNANTPQEIAALRDV
ncbi:MAG: molybdenum cofactor guanylyltransferase [Acidobacteriota bacterium]|jgi:molybdopterin-guanine dinucleotide biosynthesis protein A